MDSEAKDEPTVRAAAFSVEELEAALDAWNVAFEAGEVAPDTEPDNGGLWLVEVH